MEGGVKFMRKQFVRRRDWQRVLFWHNIFKFDKNQTPYQLAQRQNLKIQNWKSKQEKGKGEARKVKLLWGGEILAKANDSPNKDQRNDGQTR